VWIVELRIQQDIASVDEARGEMHERDLGRVIGAAEHALAEKGAADRDAIKPADQPVAVPAFDGMGVALPVKRAIEIDDRRVDPGVRPVRMRLAARLDDAREGGVERDAERVLQDAALQASGNVEGVERQQAAALRIDQEQARIIA